MSPPLLGAEYQSQCNVSLMASSAPVESISQNGLGLLESISQNGLGLKERNYLGLTDCSSVDSSAISDVTLETKKNLTMKATELRLGLPGSQSPERDSGINLTSMGKLDEKQLFPLVTSNDGICLLSQKIVVSGSKRGFCDTANELSESKSSLFGVGNWMFNSSDSGQSKLVGNTGTNVMSDILTKESKECNKKVNDSNTNSARAAKAQVVGWPPIRSYRKNTLATTLKNNDEVDGKPGPGALFVKVSMATAPYLRKVDLRTYASYEELSTGLEKMFGCFTIGQRGSIGTPSKEMLNESKLKDLLHGPDYVLTYEDKDGDWMLVGDVPWQMFITSCKRLNIMKGSDAIGLAPRAMEKSKS